MENDKAKDAEAADIEILKEVAENHPGDHDQKLKQAKRISICLNIASYGTGLWVLLFPSSAYKPAVISAMVTPMVIVVAVILCKGFLRFNGVDKSRYPVMLGSFLMPIAGLGMRAMNDFDFLDYHPLWTQAGMIAITVVLIMLLTTKEFSFRSLNSTFTVLFFAAAFYAYSISSMIIINCTFDTKNYQTHTAKILNKETTSGKRITYYLDLAPWGPRTEHEKVSVGKKGYDRTNVGDTVDVYLHYGRLNAKWFEIGIPLDPLNNSFTTR